MRRWLVLALVLTFGLGTERARADTITVAVASNFVAAAEGLGALFEKATSHRIVVVSGSTGKLFAQIENGAPFDVFLAADREAPRRVESAGLGRGAFTYARGALALWSKRGGYVDANGKVLGRADFAHLALANPELAPYGRAAREVLLKMGLFERLKARFVLGENVAQTFQFIDSENAELGFVALSQLLDPARPAGGSYWRVPEELHAPILQDGIVLARGLVRAPAVAFARWLVSRPSCAFITRYGYACPGGGA